MSRRIYLRENACHSLYLVIKSNYSGIIQEMKQKIGIYKSNLIVLTKVAEWLKFYVLQQTHYKINHLIIYIAPLIQVH